MTDIHSHILYDVDDGSKSIDESIKLLEGLKDVGFDRVILTPHYIHNDTYCTDNKEKLDKFNILKDKIIENNIGIDIYLGNEVFISDNILSNIEKGNIYCLNNSKYVLIEIPFYNRINNLLDIFYELKVSGYKVILAHPERYSILQKDYKLIDELKNDGVLFQCNYSSILGYYGSNAKKLFKYLLKNHYVDYFGTDIHRINNTYVIDNFNKIEKHIIKITGMDYYKDIINNGDRLVKQYFKYYFFIGI